MAILLSTSSAMCLVSNPGSETFQAILPSGQSRGIPKLDSNLTNLLITSMTSLHNSVLVSSLDIELFTDCVVIL